MFGTCLPKERGVGLRRTYFPHRKVKQIKITQNKTLKKHILVFFMVLHFCQTQTAKTPQISWARVKKTCENLWERMKPCEKPVRTCGKPVRTYEKPVRTCEKSKKNRFLDDLFVHFTSSVEKNTTHMICFITSVENSIFGLLFHFLYFAFQWNFDFGWKLNILDRNSKIAPYTKVNLFPGPWGDGWTDWGQRVLKRNASQTTAEGEGEGGGVHIPPVRGRDSRLWSTHAASAPNGLYSEALTRHALLHFLQ